MELPSLSCAAWKLLSSSRGCSPHTKFPLPLGDSCFVLKVFNWVEKAHPDYLGSRWLKVIWLSKVTIDIPLLLHDWVTEDCRTASGHTLMMTTLCRVCKALFFPSRQMCVRYWGGGSMTLFSWTLYPHGESGPKPENQAVIKSLVWCVLQWRGAWSFESAKSEKS